MQRMVLVAEAGAISAEVMRRGIAAETRVQVTVEIVRDDLPPVASLAAEGGGFDWLADEPNLYSDADIVAAD